MRWFPLAAVAAAAAVVVAVAVAAAPAYAAPAYAAPPTLPASLPALAQQARAVRDGFNAIAPLPPDKKALALVPHANEAAQLVRTLESIVPPPALAACYADALDGARRASASLDDMLQIYAPLAAGRDPAAFGPRITSAARHVDLGLGELEGALDACRAARN